MGVVWLDLDNHGHNTGLGPSLSPKKEDFVNTRKGLIENRTQIFLVLQYFAWN